MQKTQNRQGFQPRRIFACKFSNRPGGILGGKGRGICEIKIIGFDKYKNKIDLDSPDAEPYYHIRLWREEGDSHYGYYFWILMNKPDKYFESFDNGTFKESIYLDQADRRRDYTAILGTAEQFQAVDSLTTTDQHKINMALKAYRKKIRG